MSYHRYFAEFLGTFTLSLVVWLSVIIAMPFPTPAMAALTLGLFVYLVGGVSGAHLNPAVTLAMLSIHKIKPRDATYYVVAQCIGAIAAMAVGVLYVSESAELPVENILSVGFGEAAGTFLLSFTVTAATLKKLDASVSGLAVGLSLFIGIYLAFPLSNGVLNPAVALSIGSLGSMYILGPVLGAVAGAFACFKLFEGLPSPKNGK